MKAKGKLLAVLGVALLVLGGCTSTPDKQQGMDTEGAAAGADADGAQTSGMDQDGIGAGTAMDGAAAGEGAGQFQGDPLEDPSSLLSKRVIYFAFDDSNVPDDSTPILEAHGAYLAGHPNASVTLEGHADERGTREYNLGLGERRASSVRQYLMLMGASPSQIETVSYGEERPVSLSHDEEAWRQNRRVEIVYRNR